MPEETNSANSPSRLDRIERIVEVLANTSAELVTVTGQLQQDVKILLRAQVVMADEMQKGFARVNEEIARLAEAQRHTEERLNAFVLVVDGIVRRPPPSQ